MSGTMQTWKKIIAIAKEYKIQTVGELEEFLKNNPKLLGDTK